MTTKTYDNMTVTVTCKENEDTEMMELIKKMNDTKTARERTEEFYLPRIKAILALLNGLKSAISFLSCVRRLKILG